MKEKRAKALIVPDTQVLDLFTGNVRITNIPEGATIGPVNYSWSRDSFVLQVAHPSYNIVPEGAMLECEYALFERIKLAEDDAGNLIGYRDG